MKKLFAILLLGCLSLMCIESSAQIVTQRNGVSTAGAAKTTLTNTDTGYVDFVVDASSQSIEAVDLKTSGTVSGKVYLIATISGLKWYKLDSLTRSDGDNYKVFEIPQKINYAKYRLQWVQPTGAVSTFKAYLHRRTGQ